LEFIIKFNLKHKDVATQKTFGYFKKLKYKKLTILIAPLGQHYQVFSKLSSSTSPDWKLLLLLNIVIH
jgi:hypothetical protein